MSTLIYCDMEDCQNTDHRYDGEIYIFSNKAEVVAREVFGIYGQHLCEECLKECNQYEEIFFIGTGIYSDWLFLEDEEKE